MTKAKLIPPDLDQCQTMKPNGNGIFTLGGQPGHVRCESIPVFIAKEKKPVDGQRGSMSLCEACAKRLEELKPGFATVKRIKWAPINFHPSKPTILSNRDKQ